MCDSSSIAGSFLFVYGTLQSTFRKNRFSRYLARTGILIGSATMPGRLYALKRYPALRPAHDAELVSGEVHRLLRPTTTLRVLDAYEERHYRRVLREATLSDGRCLRCWVYEWTRPLPEHRRILAGRWPVQEW